MGRTDIRVELYPPEGREPPRIVLCGLPEEVSAARPELEGLLRHYGLVQPCAAPPNSAREDAEMMEVGGMVINSLPARERKKRKVADDKTNDNDAAGRILASAEHGEPCWKTQAAQGWYWGDAGVNQEGSRDNAVEIEGASAGLNITLSNIGDSGDLRQYEYMDHTADVILHSWGQSLSEALAQACVCFFSCMTDLKTVDLKTSFEVESSGRDILDMLYHLLDEFLYKFGTEFIVCRRVEILELDEDVFRVRARGVGERFDLGKHPQGTEIKAITMHQMKVLTANTLICEDGSVPRRQSEMEGGAQKEGFPFECYVLVDI